MRVKNLLPGFSVAIAFLLFIFIFVPFTDIFELNPDEGYNISKAALVAKGYGLYSEVWSDQPPVVTWILSGLFRLTTVSVVGARFLILAFALCLVVSFFSILRRKLGLFPAVAGVFILALSNYFSELSVSIMIGMVSLSFLMMSLACLYASENQQRPPFWIGASGILAALSLFAKAFFTLPAILLCLIEVARKPGRFRIWILSLLGSVVVLATLCGNEAVELILFPHVNAFITWQWRIPLKTLMLPDIETIVLAAVALTYIIRSRLKEHLFPVLWLAVGMGVLLIHSPLLYHHYLLVSIPLAWLGAAAIGLGKSSYMRFDCGSMPARVFPIITLFLFGVYCAKATHLFRDQRNRSVYAQEKWPPHRQIIDTLAKNGQGIQWVFTDRPMYALRAGLMVPPEIGAIPRKRLMTGEIDAAFFESVVAKYGINQVLLASLNPYYDQDFFKAVAKQFTAEPLIDGYTLYFKRRENPVDK